MSNGLGALMRLPSEKYFDSLDKKCPRGLLVQVKPDRCLHNENEDGTRTTYEAGDFVRVSARECWDLLRDGAVSPMGTN